MTPRLLIIDDDPTLLRFLKEYFEREGFTVDSAAGGQPALRLFYANRPDLVIVDVMMPGMDGWEVAARVREMADTPVIMLTAKSGEADKLRGFRLGVDDYVTKPFSFAELGARMQAVLARSRAARPPDRRVHTVGELVVDLDRRTVELHGQPVTLTPTEFRLLECLLQKEGQAVAEETLAQEVWGNYKEDPGAVRRFVWLLRKKIEDDPSNPMRILTVRGYGYRLGTPPR